MIWDYWKRRSEDDLRRLISAYRSFLKAVHQIQAEGGTPEGSEWRMLKGGFGKAFQLLFNEWPTPDETRRFEKKLRRWMEKSMELDRIFIQAFNEYLRQKRLSSEELSEVLHRGRQ